MFSHNQKNASCTHVGVCDSWGILQSGGVGQNQDSKRFDVYQELKNAESSSARRVRQEGIMGTTLYVQDCRRDPKDTANNKHPMMYIDRGRKFIWYEVYTENEWSYQISYRI